MRAPVSTFELITPRNLAGALDSMAAAEPPTPLAGGTDLYVAINAGTAPSRRYVDLWRLSELRGIAALPDGGVRLGALTTYTEILASAVVRARLPMLAAAARLVGGAQIHNRGTVGGNIANGSPAGDTLPVFAAADAVVVLASRHGERRVPFTTFYTGYRTTVRTPDELIIAIDVPPVPGRQWFRKVGTRAAQAISKVVVAAVRHETSRIAIGSVAPTVVRARRTERALAGGVSIADARQVLDEEIAPIDDIRSNARYRRQVAGNLLEQWWHETGPTTR